MARIVFGGMLAGVPGHGGATWAVLQYLLGLRRLGHDVLLVEPVAELSTENARYFADVVGRFGLEGRAALLSPDAALGLPRQRVLAFAREADAVLNVAGMLTDEALLEGAPVRVYLDLDPAFTQLWQDACGIDMRLAAHTHFATVGLALGAPGCTVPTCGRSWIATVPPVVLDEWRPANGVLHDAFTSVGNWRAYGSVEHDGVHYAQKAHSVRALIDLPRRTDARILLAYGVHPDERADHAALAAYGWHLVDPASVAATPDAYRDFVRSSRAELGIAKSGYVLSRCGWFSDRSACYLAAGRPVLAQDTGFGDRLPTGEGLLTFTNAETAAAAVEDVQANYARHARAARELAEEHFDSDHVLPRLLERVGVA
jgi:hypothetical protein